MNICTFNQQQLSADGTQNIATTPSRPTLHVTSDKTLLLQIFSQRQLASAYIFKSAKAVIHRSTLFQLQFCNHTTVDKSFIV